MPGRCPELRSSKRLLELHDASSDSISNDAPCMPLCQRTESKIKNSGSGPKKAVSAIPVDLRNASARLAIERGQREYACIVLGSSTSQLTIIVGWAANGSTIAVAG